MLPRFLKVFPHEYKRVLAERRAREQAACLPAAASAAGQPAAVGVR